ncbi:MAG: glycoside hydrolase family 3 C-terminal domain-containing protein, partial [Gemmatimonadota bacterium]
RLLETKARAGLHRSRTVDLRRIPEIVGSREHVAFADSAAVRSLTLPRDRERLIPLDTARFRRILSLGFAREANLPAGRAFERELAGRVPELETARLSPSSGDAAYQATLSRIRSADLVVLSVYLPPFERSGSVAPPEALRRLVGEATRAGTPVVLISFGNPYLLTDFPELGTYLLVWGDESVSQRAAARGLLGRVPITGKLPISLPPFHRRGEGLRRPRVERTSSP